MYSIRKRMCFWTTEASISILVDLGMNIENEHKRASLMISENRFLKTLFMIYSKSYNNIILTALRLLLLSLY